MKLKNLHQEIQNQIQIMETMVGQINENKFKNFYALKCFVKEYSEEVFKLGNLVSDLHLANEDDENLEYYEFRLGQFEGWEKFFGFK